MRVRKYFLVSPLAVLAACSAAVTPPSDVQAPQIIDELPEGVAAIAAPYQNLDAVQLLPDGCYWYSHAGPVETTLLPLRTVAGNPICARAPAPQEPTPSTG
jgi:hypothetical protein